MDWVKLTTNYYNDAAIMRAGEAAEVLFTRALAYCGDQENGGLIPREVLPRLTPTKGTARAAALVREGLWEVVAGGWRFVNWDRHQTDLTARREAGRRRQQTYRDRTKTRNAHRDASRNAQRDAVTNANVTQREEEVEVDAAAAAAARDTPTPRPPAALPPAVEILRSALEAHNLTVRWDTLTVDQIDEITHLVDDHGDAALVASAMRAYQPNKPPVYATAWLNGWRALRAPGDLAAVTTTPCPAPGHSGTTRHCAQCASEKKAAR